MEGRAVLGARFRMPGVQGARAQISDKRRGLRLRAAPCRVRPMGGMRQNACSAWRGSPGPNGR
eukprot:4393640-Lingulodinium_polyedra.AAC.1